MYNIHSHYENIFRYLTSIIAHPRIFYLYPYGSTQPENVESLSNYIPDDKLPINFFFYDQEPIVGEYNYPLFDYINQQRGVKILVTTEKNSQPLTFIQQQYQWPVVYYFHHVFAAHDWFRGARYQTDLVPIKQRIIKKKYITFNRLTSSARVYRSLLINELFCKDILDQGYVSYNDTCPYGGTYQENLQQAAEHGYITEQLSKEAIDNIGKIKLPLRIDYTDQAVIPNHSFSLSAVKETQESFCYVVTETCYWEPKHHLTEKTFKPIVSKMPFILVGPYNNLEYLREYGFKTFAPWIDEGYDKIKDPIDRMEAIGSELKRLCSYTTDELKDMLVEMKPVLEHNYRLFYSHEFLDHCWDELLTNLGYAVPT